MEQMKHTRLRHRSNSIPPTFLKSSGGAVVAPAPAAVPVSQIKAPPKQVNYRQEEKRILDRILDEDIYDSRMRPSGINSTGNRFTRLIFASTFPKIVHCDRH